MSKESSIARRRPQPEPNENDFEAPANPVQFPPPRTPLNSIADPAQLPKEFHELDSDSQQPKLEAVRSGRFSLSERRLEGLDKVGNVGLGFGTPRVSGRGGKAHSEPNSAQSTPARNRASFGGCGVSRAPLYSGHRAGSSSRIIPVANSEILTQVQHFELVEDSSFWTDHNVQVLIRIRPLSSMERALQGCGRCLKQESSQSLVLLGHPEARFTFDHIACETISQEKLFKVSGLPMVENCLSGYNSCMFAYGQTGSGKTYTMMGEINESEGQLNEDCGITPRIFEYLFKRIRLEEESRREEQLKYSCKCSFLEIYNEQITDLLEPSSTNLQLREDMKKGVYVENLTEYNVTNVDDVVKLLLHGASNRKMAATHMNSESSRSHSVFTCIIESHWENDSMTHFRFARLNLVDLAGSERQKGSGAEGDRLKEAANINKSLSTLGLVIMSLVDLAHGKHRHVPYRDSRLTFLLQDSLGGNSKTTIIANVSPSSCSANETLSTLKFAQRAKLIQNNAKVNEDASGDITALQRHIQHLKGQLSFLMKHHNLSLSSSSGVPSIEEPRGSGLPDEDNSIKEKTDTDSQKTSSFQSKKLNSMETILVGALRREKVADDALQNLVAEIEHMNCLACEREEDSRHTKLMLRTRDEKIKRLELLVDGMLSAEKYLMKENKALQEEIQMLQARPDENPELTHYAVENSRLLEQLQLYQKFYEEGERETLLNEVSDLRNQLLDTLQRKLPFSSENENQNSDIRKELEDCKNMNSKLIREVDELQLEMRKYMSSSQAASDSVRDSFSKDAEEFRQSVKNSTVETLSLRSDCGYEMASYTEADDEALQNHDQNGDDDTRKKLIDAKMLIEEKEPEQEIMGSLMDMSKDVERKSLQAKLEKMAEDLEKVKLLNSHFQEDQLLQLSCQKQTEMVCEQVEMETARTILHLQEEVAALQFELDEKLQCMINENTTLKSTIASKEGEIRTLRMDWEKATLELTRFLLDGSRSLKNASSQIESITCSFPQANVCISENVQRAAKVCLEKEETIELLQKSLEDAQKMVTEMGEKLSSLKGATMALSELQHLNSDEKMKYNDIHYMIHGMRNELTVANGRLKNIEDFVCTYPSRKTVLGDEDEWSTDSSTSSYDSSSESISSGHVLWTMEGQLQDSNVEEVSVLQSAHGDPEKSKLLSSFSPPEGEIFCLKKELEITIDAFNNLYVQLASLAGETVAENHSPQGDVKQLVQPFKLKTASAYAGCHTTVKLVGSEKNDFASSFLVNFEEANATIKEADLMLNALLEANENSKQLTGLWKQTGEELMLERARFIEEVEHLKCSLLSKERENLLLQNQSCFDLAEIGKSVSLLEECFMQLKSDVEDRFNTIYADVFSMGSNIRSFISSSRSLLEEIYSETLKKEFAMFVLHQCLRGELVPNMSCVNLEIDYHQFRSQEGCSEMNKMHKVYSSGEESTMLSTLCIDDGDQCEAVTNLKERECSLSRDTLIHENLVLKEELQRREALLEGLHFDFRTLQESTSNTKDMKDETQKLIQSLRQIQLELELKTCHLDDMLVEQRKLQDHLNDTEEALLISNSNLQEANETVETLSEQNIELKVLLKDLYLHKVEAEEQLEEQKEVVKGLEKEILHLNSSMEEKIVFSVEGIHGDLRMAISERDRLLDEVQSLNDKLEMACAIADENEAISVEARQDAETSKMYAEQKEEEVKILEHSVEELECTINVLEKKVYEMDDEVERHRLIRDALELELQALRQRLSTVKSFTENADSENTKTEEDEDLISRQLKSKLLELHEAHNRIKILEEERAERDKEIKQCKEYISELVLHAEAQAAQYQQKYKTLEAMVCEVKADKTYSATNKTERSSIRTRGSGSPFRCISSLVQQMNTEKDQELSTARLRIEELEALAASQQKEVCLLNTRLAATESMTHDVIRDLLGVKLDMTNYADLIDQYQVQKLVEEAHHQTEDFLAKEKEILNLRKQVTDLMEERQSCITEIEKKEGDILAAQMSMQELEERDQMLSAQNEMLKTDKTKLKRRVSELDDMVKTILGKPSTRHPSQQTSTSKVNLIKQNSAFRLHDGDFTRRVEQSEKELSRVNGELAQYIKSGGGQARDRQSHGSELDYRKLKNLSMDKV
ncbi:kinesin-like protein KIN-12C [Argentina anserina]|uniref:kinesin-like protein KIN-12C n=1 Tax=Argentina anserina TaxID=57926 RepID=UPI00217680E4|nr:kinesin-like protein KIN-12C [Potentilla anserina]